MSTSFPDVETLRSALNLAARAPSVHNSQPWFWRVGPHSLHLYQNEAMHLRHTDPDRRDVMVSCGAVLNHCVIALAAFGWQATVHRLPDPAEPDHLASLQLSRRTPTTLDVTLAAAIPQRRTDRRRYSRLPVPLADIALMSSRAARAGVRLFRIEDVSALKLLVQQAMYTHLSDDAYLRELTTWSGRHASLAGVPARNTPAPEPGARLPARVFAGATMPQPPATSSDNAEVLALGTWADDNLARLRAGEATSTVLLTATAVGLSTCPITEPLELPRTRAAVRAEIFDGREFPQMLLRVGWPPANANPLPSTPRRPLSAVVTRLDGSPFE